MKLVLMSNILEHVGFFACIKKWVNQEPDLGFLVCGDLLNVFPEPGEDLQGSIFSELYGNWIVEEMDAIISNRFQQLAQSRFISPLKAMFTPNGATFAQAETIARRRYQAFFEQLAPVLKNCPFYYIPGNMDYPHLGWQLTAQYPHIHQLDNRVVTLGGYRLGALGGIPNNAHPFAGLADISPYEMAAEEYARRLWGMDGVDLLITHLSPDEYSPLWQFIRTTPLKALICRAPFDFRRTSDFRGAMEVCVDAISQKPVYKIRPFDFPLNHALVIDLENTEAFNGTVTPSVFSWSANGCGRLTA